MLWTRATFRGPSCRRQIFYLINVISMAKYVSGTYRQTQLFYWLIIVRFTTTCFGPIPGPSSGCITT